MVFNDDGKLMIVLCATNQVLKDDYRYSTYVHRYVYSLYIYIYILIFRLLYLVYFQYFVGIFL